MTHVIGAFTGDEAAADDDHAATEIEPKRRLTFSR